MAGKLGKTLQSARHKALIELLIAKRKEAGLTQTDLAKRLGEYQSFVARMELGQRRVDVVEFLAIAQELNINLGYAFKKIAKAER